MSKELPAIFRLAQHSVTKKRRVETKETGDEEWTPVQDLLCEGGWWYREFYFKWRARIAMCSMIAKEIERVTIKNGEWETK